ncbi:TonB-dependent receptor domain-containing protein [Epilithonimonas sp.]|uniref:TonB-dependent receptor plug domain-containing protein n=1 Tax=Epilithonimonas sp. TaxID=2894511 RepID=UPI00289907D7|nr:TonB-dependent receptor [Epilithonimonas sp.]
MKAKTISISALFLCMSTTALLAQSTPDTIKGEKKIDEVKIIGTSKKGTENNIITTQKKSVEVIERVGSAQLSKQGIGDVAAAVTKATGTLKQEGSGQIFVRGLGDRYNTTTLNGLPIPSDDPEFKNIDLEIFKTSMIEYISLDKVYNPKLYGDFGGANINIVSKEHTGKPYFKVGLGSAINMQTFDKGNFKLQDGGPGFFGYKTSTFNKSNPGVAYPFTTKWNFKNAQNPFNSNLDFETGARFGKFSIFAYAGFDNSYEYSSGKESFFFADGRPDKDYNVERYEYETNTTALVNLAYKINSNNKLTFTSNYIHSSSQTARFFEGYTFDIGTDVVVNRGDNKITDTWINQLVGNHKLGKSWEADWALGYNKLNSKRPDRLQNTMSATDNILIAGSIVDNHRYFDELKDDTFLGYLHLTKKLNDFKFSFGYDGSYKNRTFDFTTIGIRYANPYGLSLNIDPNNYDAFFNSTNSTLYQFIYQTFRGTSELYKPWGYDIKQHLHSGYANVDYNVSDKLVVQLGGRFDYINWDMDWNDPLNTDKKQKSYNKFLPALNAKYSVNDRTNLRLSLSKTYTLPQPKELIPIAYYDVTTNVYGNENLYPSDNYNVDLKWEFFPKSGEIISVAAFGKYIKNPIARTTYSTASSSDMTYFNIANWGYIVGAEAEWRKDIYEWEASKIYTFINATYMHSQQELKSSDELAAENEGKRAEFSGQTKEDVQGVADFIANANLGYNFKWNDANSLDFVVSYSYVGKNLFALGTNNTGNFYEASRNMLDTNLNVNLKNIGIGVFVRNILNPEYRIDQVNTSGTYINRNYTKGRLVGLNLSYKF